MSMPVTAQPKGKNKGEIGVRGALRPCTPISPLFLPVDWAVKA